MNRGNLDLALADFDRALAIDPASAGAYADRGRAYELKGDRAQAIADYRKALSLKSRQLYDDKAKAEAKKHWPRWASRCPTVHRRIRAPIRPPIPKSRAGSAPRLEAGQADRFSSYRLAWYVPHTIVSF